MALSIQASPTLPSLDLGGLLPTPTLPPIVGQVESIITSVIDGVTSLIPTLIPSPTLPAEVTSVLPAIAVATPTPTPTVDEGQVLGLLASKALDAFPTMLLQNLAAVQSAYDSAISAAATPVPIVYVTTEAEKVFTKTSFAPTPTFATTGVINPLSILASALPNPTGIMSEVTSVIGGVTSILPVPLPLPTGLLPLLGSMKLPEIDLPMLLGNKQDACIKDGNGNQIGLCGDGPVLNDSETISLV